VSAPAVKPTGNVLSYEVAYSQAVTALDKAAEWAVQSKNIDALTTIASLWVQMGNSLLENTQPDDKDDEEDESDLDSEPRYPMGFSPNTKEEELEDE